MIRLIYRKFRSMCVRLDRLLHTPTPIERWMAIPARTGVIHPSIQFTHLLPNQNNCVLGERCILDMGVTIWLADEPAATPQLKLGNDVYVGKNTFLGSYFPISIGDNTLIGADSYIISANHGFSRRDIPIRKQGYFGAPVAIGEGVWLGAHVIVLPGVTIGQGAIVGAGSVVTRSIPPFEIWAGSPARWIKNRP